jgi:large subunit ribosomal protein L9
VDKSQAMLHQPIKALGNYVVPLSLHPEVKVDVAVVVARSEEEAMLAAKEPEAEEVAAEEIVAEEAPETPEAE